MKLAGRKRVFVLVIAVLTLVCSIAVLNIFEFVLCIPGLFFFLYALISIGPASAYKKAGADIITDEYRGPPITPAV